MNLSLIIPVYNGAERIAGTLTELLSFLEPHVPSFEIIVIDDGSTDDTRLKINSIASPRIVALENPVNLGKFGAIARGIERARGSACVFTDSDLPFDLEAIPYIATLINERRFHVVVGDRSLSDSVYREVVPLSRRIGTAVYSHSVRLLLTGGLFDTQCGLKGFRTDVAKPLFALMREKRFAGDVELLYLALKYNLEIKRIPVRLRNAGASTVSLWRDSFSMLGRLLSLPPAWHLGMYRSEALAQIAAQKYWK